VSSRSNRRARSRSWHALALLVCGALASCASTPAPTAGELQEHAAWRAASALARPVAERRQALVRIESSAFSGSYRALLVLERAPRSRARLQLFPLAGPKLLDIVVALEGYELQSAADGLARTWSSASGERIPRAFASFLALALLEQAEPWSPSRVLRARATEHGGLELELRGPWPGTRIECELGPSGELRERRYALRGVHWTERISESEHAFRAEGFDFELSEQRTSAAEAFPPSLFELDAAP